MINPKIRASEVGFAGSWYALSARVLHDRVLVKFALSEWLSRGARRWLDLEQPENVVEIYILVVTGVICYFWLSLPTGGGVLRSAAIAVSAYRLFEVVVVALGIVVESFFVVAGKSLLTAALYGVQMMLIFATLGEAFTPSARDWSPRPVSHLDWIYMAFTNMFSLGNGFSPASQGSKLVVMGSLGSGILVLSIFVAYAIGQYARTR